MASWQAKRRIGDVTIFLNWDGKKDGTGGYEGYASTGMDGFTAPNGENLIDYFFNKSERWPSKSWAHKNGVTFFPFAHMYPSVIDRRANYKSKKEFDSAARSVIAALRTISEGGTWWLWSAHQDFGQKEAKILVKAAGHFDIDVFDNPMVKDNPDNPGDGLTIHMYYSDGPAYWLLGHLEEFSSFNRANRKLNEWFDASRGRGSVGFAVYIDGDLVYKGTYDLAVAPADLKRQINLYLETLDTPDAVILLNALASQNPKRKLGYIDPDTGARMSRRLYDEGYYHRSGVSDMSAPVVEQQPTIDDINRALISGTIGIGTSGMVTEASSGGVGDIGPRRARHGVPQVATDEDLASRLSAARLQEISTSHDLDLGGYEYVNVRDDWVPFLRSREIGFVAEIDADVFAGEVMGSARDFFGHNIHSMSLPIILFTPSGHFAGNANWPEMLPGGHDEFFDDNYNGKYKLVDHGVLNEYEHDCICVGDPDSVSAARCHRCGGRGYLTHEGGDWALYDFVENIEILNERYGRPEGPNADWINPTWFIGPGPDGDGGLYIQENYEPDSFSLIHRTVGEEDEWDDDIFIRGTLENVLEFVGDLLNQVEGED